MPWLLCRASALVAAGFVSSLSSTVVAQTSPPSTAAAPPPCVPAPEPPPDPYGPGSVLVRFSAGPGYMWGNGDSSTTLQSVAGGFAFAMGGFVTRGLALHGDFGWLNGFDPDYSVEGTIDHETSLVFQTSSIRAGASYYSGPARLYASLSVGVGVALMTSIYYGASATLSSTEYSKAGPSVLLQLGKDWEISRYWAFGVAVDYQYLNINADEDDDRIVIDNAHQVGLRFVATFAGK